jgi:SET domain-containing protein
VTYAIQDIQPGEEMTGDYSTFEDPSRVDNILFEIARKYDLTDELSLAPGA